MKKMFTTVAVQVLAIGSFLRAYFSLPKNEQDQLSWQVGTSIICIILFLTILWEIGDYYYSRPRSFRFLKQKNPALYASLVKFGRSRSFSQGIW